MSLVDPATLDLMPVESALDPTRRVRVAFPYSSATGAAASAAVYFEVEPNCHVGVHTDSAEEFLIVLEGTADALAGTETVRMEAGQVILVPAMLRHDLTNVGTDVLRVLGTFGSATVIATFEEPVAPGGPQVFVIGGPMPIVLPLAEPAEVAA